MNEMWISILEFLGLAWWVEIITENPGCTYYFGPFATAHDAKSSMPGYIEDLEQEGARGIKVSIKRCKPSQLTIFDEATEKSGRPGISPIFSGQM
jgi:hypothetical protein